MKREDGDGSREIMKHEPWLPSNGDDMSGMLEVVTTDAYMEPEEEPSASSTAASYAPQQLVVASADSAHAPSDAPPKAPLIQSVSVVMNCRCRYSSR